MLKTKSNRSRRPAIVLRGLVNGFAEAVWQYDTQTTKAMIIERTAKETGRREVITFNQAYGELSIWLGKAFVNISDYGFSDMLAAEFFQGAVFHTRRAEYRFWNRHHFNN